MLGRARYMPARALHTYAGPRGLDALPRALETGTISQRIQQYIGAFLAAIAANDAGHRSTPAYGGTAAATTLCPSCAAAAKKIMKPQQRLPGRMIGLGKHKIL